MTQWIRFWSLWRCLYKNIEHKYEYVCEKRYDKYTKRHKSSLYDSL